MEPKARTIDLFRYTDGRCPFTDWFDSLKTDVQAVVAKRLDRVEKGLLGDSDPVGEGVSELRIHYGPGYRIFVGFLKDIVVVLTGCDKTAQKRTIPLAQGIWKEYKSRIA
jgi:putative addiction module killer protein